MNELAKARIELLAPAGDFDCICAAVENGADAIYFGLSKFNARMRAENFTVDRLPELVSWMHRRGVKAYVTLNILIFSNELEEAACFLGDCVRSGVDAIIIQDIGVAALARAISPDIPIFASTQMTLSSAEGIRWVHRRIGLQRVILARELSLKEIGKISAQPDMPELESFVHGALCVAYSGQCLTSEALGGRSANRGECAQACRMPYELIAEGRQVDLGDRKYLLSPRDLAGYALIGDLIDAGVRSFKIEGRLKAPEYVAAVTRVYRKAIDAWMSGESITDAVNERDRYELEMTFSRGFHTGWLGGMDNQKLVHARFGKKRGVYLGDVERVNAARRAVTLRPVAGLARGEGVVFDAGSPEIEEEGGRVWDVRDLPGGEVEVVFGPDAVDFRRVRAGNKLWKTDDPEMTRRLRASFEGAAARRRVPIRIEVSGGLDTPMLAHATDDAGNRVMGATALPLCRAERRPLTDEFLREQLGRLGDSAYRLEDLVNSLEPGLILPVSEVNRLRRDLVERLDAARCRPIAYSCLDVSLDRWRTAPGEPAVQADLSALVRNLPQLEAALDLGLVRLYADFEDGRRYDEAVERVRQARESGVTTELFISTPRIQKPGEEAQFRQLLHHAPDGILVRSLGAVEFFTHSLEPAALPRLMGDYPLNVANEIAASVFMEAGLERITASYDLNLNQLLALLAAAPPAWFEITIHQHMPMFHMDHCVFCAFLTDGTDFTNCGRPCDRVELRLRDRMGMEHPVTADVGCRNTVYNAAPQSAGEYVPALLKAGARSFRVEFVQESPAEVRRVIACYRRLLEGTIEAASLWHEIKALHQLGEAGGQPGGHI